VANGPNIFQMLLVMDLLWTSLGRCHQDATRKTAVVEFSLNAARHAGPSESCYKKLRFKRALYRHDLLVHTSQCVEFVDWLN